MRQAIAKAFAERAAGKRHSVPHALVVAAATGVAAAGLTYRVMRS